MTVVIRDEDVEDYLPVPLTAEQIAWLKKLAEATGDPPGHMVASMIEHIRRDDLAAHGEDQTRH